MQLDRFEIPQPHIREQDIPMILSPEGLPEHAPCPKFFKTANIFLTQLEPFVRRAADTDGVATTLHFFLIHDPRGQIAVNATPTEVQRVQDSQQLRFPFVPKYYLPGLTRTGQWPHKTITHHAVLGVEYCIPVSDSRSANVYTAQGHLRQLIIGTNTISKKAECIAREGITEKLAAPYLTQNPDLRLVEDTTTGRRRWFLQTTPYYVFLLS